MKDGLWFRPDYFDSFACKCGACRNTCCRGWEVTVSMDEYFALMGLECSAPLRRKLDVAFAPLRSPSPEAYMKLAAGWDGNCRMLDGDGLCSLQRECGEEVLSAVCRLYPRSLRNVNGVLHACCSASCEGVTEALMCEEPLRFSFGPEPFQPILEADGRPCAPELTEVCVSVMQDRSLSISSRVKEICMLMGSHAKQLFPLLTDFSYLMDVLPVLCSLSPSMDPYLENARKRYLMKGRDLYYEDCSSFRQRYPMWEKWFENLMVNHIFFTGFPYADAAVSRRDSCIGLCLACGLLMFSAVSWTAEHGEPEDLADVLSAAFRLLEHTPFYHNALIIFRNGGDNENNAA